MKKIGIGCDDYKVTKFKRALKVKGFTDFNVTQFMEGVSFISVNVAEDKFNESVQKISKICMELEINFKQSN